MYKLIRTNTMAWLVLKTILLVHGWRINKRFILNERFENIKKLSNTHDNLKN